MSARPSHRLLVGLCLWIGGCSVPQSLCLRPDAVRSVDLQATSDANGDRPVAVDLVFARAEPAAAALAGLSAREYFARRAQLLADFPGELGASSWELVPGQHVAGAATVASCGVVATYLFADYAAPGAHRLRVTQTGRVAVVLGPDAAALAL
jgi:type VI secretion system protein